MDLKEKDLDVMRQIFADELKDKNYDVYLLGIRQEGSAVVKSTFDTVLKTVTDIDHDTITRLKEAFGATDFTFNVDILDFFKLPEGFQEQLERQAFHLVHHDKTPPN